MPTYSISFGCQHEHRSADTVKYSGFLFFLVLYKLRVYLIVFTNLDYVPLAYYMPVKVNI